MRAQSGAYRGGLKDSVNVALGAHGIDGSGHGGRTDLEGSNFGDHSAP